MQRENTLRCFRRYQITGPSSQQLTVAVSHGVFPILTWRCQEANLNLFAGKQNQEPVTRCLGRGSPLFLRSTSSLSVCPGSGNTGSVAKGVPASLGFPSPPHPFVLMLKGEQITFTVLRMSWLQPGAPQGLTCRVQLGV